MITLSDITTRELLAQYKSRWGQRSNCDEWDDDETFTFRRMCPGDVIETVTVDLDDLRAEINRREHVPNKKQAAVLRKICAEKGCTKEEAWANYPKEFFPKNRRQVTKEYYKTMVRYYGKDYAAKVFVIK